MILPESTRTAHRAAVATGAHPPATPPPGLLHRIGITPAFVGFLAYVFVIVTFRFPIGELGVAIGFLGLFLQRVRLHLPQYLGWHLGFVLWCAMTYGWTPNPAITQEAVTQAAKVWLIMFLGVNAVRSRTQLAMLVLFILFWFFVYPVRGTIVNYVTGNTFFGRSAWNGVLSNPNYLAATCLVPISSAAALMAVWRRKLVVAAGSIVLATLVGVMILTQSRAGMLALFVFTASAVVGSRKRGKAIMASLGLAIVVLAVAPPEAWERLGGLTKLGGRRTDWRSVDEEGSAEQRFQIAQTALAIIGDHPLGGTGSGTYPIMNERYNPVLGPRDTHNTYLHVTAEQGFIGLVLFLGMLVSVVRLALIRAAQLMESAPHGAGAIRLLAAGLASFLVAGIWGSYDNFQILYVLCLLLYLSARLAGPDLVTSSGRGGVERTPPARPLRSPVAPRR